MPVPQMLPVLEEGMPERCLPQAQRSVSCGWHAGRPGWPLVDLGLPWVPSSMPRKDYVEELECELEPQDAQTAGPANISLIVTNMPPGKHFRVDGISIQQGFSFMVRPWPCLCPWPEGQYGWGWLDGKASYSRLSHCHPFPGAQADSSTAPLWPTGRGHSPHPGRPGPGCRQQPDCAGQRD